MPNTGKPSQDCHLCRRRRVKCDLTRPGCNRCVKYGVECPGYRNQQELVFRNANPSGSRKKKKKKKDSPSADDSFSDPTQSPSSSTNSASSSPPVTTVSDIVQRFRNDATVPSAWVQPSQSRNTMPRSLNQHWTQQSVSILLNVYSALDFVHNTYRRYDMDGPLQWAAHLFSRTYVTNLRNSSAIYTESAEENKNILAIYMSKTLNAVSSALSSPQGAFRDDVLATVWILANYEILVGSLDRDEPLSPWHLHAKGIYSILKTRGAESFMTDVGRVAFWPTFNMIQIQCLVSNTPPPPETEEWLRVVRHHMDDMEGLALNISSFINKVCEFQARAIVMIRNNDFVGVAEYYPEAWSYMKASEDEVNEWIDKQPAFGHELDPYMRNMQYSATIKGFHILQMMSNMMTHYPQSPVPLPELIAHRKHCLQTIRISAQSIIKNIPYAIGPMAKGRDKSPRVLFDALKLVWPLVSIYTASTTLPEQQENAGAALQFMGHELGVRQAAKAHMNKSSAPLEAQAPLQVADMNEGLQWVAVPINETLALKLSSG